MSWLIIGGLSLIFNGPALAAPIDRAVDAVSSNSGVIDNQTLTQICSIGESIFKEYGDEERLKAASIDVVFSVSSYSKSEGILSGTFMGRAGSFAEDIYLIVYVGDAVVPTGLRKEEKLRVIGTLRDGDNFRGPISDSCFLKVNAERMAIDGF